MQSIRSSELAVPFSPLAMFTCDPNGYIINYNQAFVQLLEYQLKPDNSLWYTGLKMFSHEGIRMEPAEHPINKTLKTGLDSESIETGIEMANGTVKKLLVFSKAVFDQKGAILAAQNTLVDITGVQGADLNRATLSAIVESSDDAIISKNLNGTIRSWNSGAEQIFGYSAEEVIGKSITILIPADRLKEENLILKSVKKGKKVNHFNTIRKHKSGREIHISLTVSPIKDIKGNIIGASKIARDVSAQVKAQQEIQQHTRNMEVLNSISKSISEKLDVQTTLQRVTDGTTQITGAAFGAFFYNTVNHEGESFMLYTLSGAPREAFEKFGMPRNTAVFNPTFTGQGVVRSDDITKDPRYGHNSPHKGMPQGHLPVVSYLAVPVISKSGEVIGGLFFGHPKPAMFSVQHENLVLSIAAQAAIALDNSRLFEQVKSLSDKKDEFIALASHELRTPMTTIKGYLQVLSRQDLPAMNKLFVERSLNQINKLNSLVEDMLQMSKIEAGKLEFNSELFDLRQMLAEMAHTFGYSYPSHQLITTLPDLKITISGDPQRIEQALVNLLNNAVKYSPKADKVYLTLELQDDQAIVKVRDLGIGLSKDQQKNIFSRFYRAENTKGISGLGLGLYLTKQIIDRHHGTITFESAEGRGSEFSFILPVNR